MLEPGSLQELWGLSDGVGFAGRTLERGQAPQLLTIVTLNRWFPRRATAQQGSSSPPSDRDSRSKPRSVMTAFTSGLAHGDGRPPASMGEGPDNGLNLRNA